MKISHKRYVASTNSLNSPKPICLDFLFKRCALGEICPKDHQATLTGSDFAQSDSQGGADSISKGHSPMEHTPPIEILSQTVNHSKNTPKINEVCRNFIYGLCTHGRNCDRIHSRRRLEDSGSTGSAFSHEGLRDANNVGQAILIAIGQTLMVL